MGARSIFPGDINAIRSDINEKEAVIPELKNILSQDHYLETIFKRFQVNDTKFHLIFFLTDAHLTLPQMEYERNSDETQNRRQIFAKNLLKIAKHNLDYRNGEDTWIEVVSKFDDLVCRKHFGSLNKIN